MNLAELKLLANAFMLLRRLPIYLKQENIHSMAYSYMLNLFSCQKNVKQGKGSYTIRNLDSTSVKQHKT